VLNGHEAALTCLLRHGANPEPRPITQQQMGKRTHLVQETPAAVACRVHGEGSEFGKLLTQASLRKNAACANDSRIAPALMAEASRFLITIAEPRLERQAVEELKERLGASLQRSQCRIFFKSAVAPENFFHLKAAEKICAVVLHSSATDLCSLAEACSPGTAEVEKAAAAWLLTEGAWMSAFALWRRFHGLYEEMQEPLTFKVTCRRKGKRFAHVSSQALAVVLASSLTAAYGWKAQVRRPDLEVRVLLGDADLLVDLPLLFQSAIRIGGGEIVDAGLSAQVAWALARTANLVAGERVLDPMCGRGVVLVEAVLSWPSCHYIGLDLDPTQLHGAARNAALLHDLPGIDLMHGDALHLPLPDGCIGAIVCDIPFGRQYSSIEECRSGLYNDLLAEFDRVVDKSMGRMVLLSSLEQEAWVLQAAGFPYNGAAEGSHRPWVCVARRRLPLGNLDAVILAFGRPDSTHGVSLQPVPEPCDRLWWETSAGRADWSSLKVSARPPMQLARGREI